MSESSYLNELLKEHSLAVVEYTGDGILITSDHRQTQCSFEAVQLPNGNIFFVCGDLPLDFYSYRLAVPAVSFQGTTSNGSHFSTAEFDIQTEASIGRIVFLLKEFRITRPNSASPSEIRFGLTNFKMIGDKIELTAPGGRVLAVSFKTPRGQTYVKVSRLSDYELISRRLSRLKGIDVTSEAIFQISDSAGTASSYEIINHLCYILSVAAGTKIQWVYSTACDERGDIVQCVHSARVTKPYNSLALIDGESHRTAEIATFIEKAYPAYVQRRELFRLDRGAIDAYLDAKASGDYLEARGSKLAVSLELLKSILLTHPDISLSRFVVDKQRFAILKEKIKDAMRPVLMQEQINSEQRSKFYSNLPALNNTTFKELIHNLFNHIDLSTPTSDIELFVACRNKLIHEGAFYCNAATKEEAERCPPQRSPWLEYAFMVGFLDRIFLKIFDYDGPYIDWQSGAPIRKDQV